MTRQLVDNVWSFLDRAGSLYAKVVEQRWCQEMHSNCVELGMESPIEDLFWIAVNVMCMAEYEPINPGPEIGRDGPYMPKGLYIQPQVKIGDYRVDFVIHRDPHVEAQRAAPLVIELDGHDFHDKDKRQRAYEKARDRFLVKQGYRVLHFTGSEIVKDPFKAAHEALCLMNVCSSPEYDPANPLGIE